jgi:hypothetical protein
MSKNNSVVGHQTIGSANLEEEIKRLREENERLKEWIRQEGMRNDTCTYDVLHEICEGCRCKRQPQQNDQGEATAPEAAPRNENNL